MTSKSEFIMNTLEPMWPEGDYIYRLYESWCRFKPLKPGTYDGFRHVISILKKEGRIEEYKRETKKPGYPVWDKRFYRVTGR